MIIYIQIYFLWLNWVDKEEIEVLVIKNRKRKRKELEFKIYKIVSKINHNKINNLIPKINSFQMMINKNRLTKNLNFKIH